MSQIDKIIYLPLLFWFIILLFILYFFIFSYFFSIFLSILKVRIIFYKEIKYNCIRKFFNSIIISDYHRLISNLLYTIINISINRYIKLKNNKF